jgi:ribosomal protein S12 methylthiotransferase accessory factor
VAWTFFGPEPDFAFHDWNIAGDTQQELQELQRIIHDEGRDIYIADHDEFGVYCCRVLVPGMSEIYPLDELLWNNNNSGLPFRDRLLHLPSLAGGELSGLLDALEADAIDESLPLHEFIGLAADPGSALATLRIGELKGLLLLATGRRQEAIEWLEWLGDFGELGGERMRAYDCLLQILLLERNGDAWESYGAMLAAMFGEAAYRRALELFFGRRVFDGLDLDEGTVLSERHQQLFRVYRRISALRAQA